MNHKPQEILDVMFQILLTRHSSSEYFKDKTQDEVVEWATDQLKQCGIDTSPVGSNYAVLKQGGKK